MANTAHPGFFPSRVVNGGEVTYRRARVLSNNTNSINLQDAVTVDTNGNALGTAQSSTLATAVASVAMGVSYIDANLVRVGAKSLPAATTYTGSLVNPDAASYVFLVEGVHNVVFEASCDTAITLAALYANASINLAAPVNGISAQELNVASLATTATLPFRLTEFIIGPGSDPDLAHAHVFCMINVGQIEPALTVTGL